MELSTYRPEGQSRSQNSFDNDGADVEEIEWLGVVAFLMASVPSTMARMIRDYVKPPGKSLQKRKLAQFCLASPLLVAGFPLTLGTVIAKEIQDYMFYPMQSRFNEFRELLGSEEDDAPVCDEPHFTNTVKDLGFQAINLSTDHYTSSGWHFKTQRPPKGVIICFGSNGLTATGVANIYAKKFTDAEFDTVFAQHPGYGGSDGSIYSDHDIKLAAFTAYERTCELYEKDMPIHVYGSSIGTAPAMCLAAKKERIKRVVLNAPFRSYKKIAKASSALIPKWLIRYNISTEKNIRRLINHSDDTKVFLVHATGDKHIPYSESEKMAQPYYACRKKDRRVYLHTAGGSGSFYTGHCTLNKEDIKQITTFLQS